MLMVGMMQERHDDDLTAWRLAYDVRSAVGMQIHRVEA